MLILKTEAIKDSDKTISEQGMVLHVDGGVRPNPGSGGWGLHGYLYEKTVPKKSSGNSTHILTTSGYISKVDIGLKLDPNGSQDKSRYNEITPVHYVDGFGSFGESISNNVAELVAAINAFTHAIKYDIKELNILTDSEYVRKGLEGWVDTWKRNNWLKHDLTEPANLDHWKQLVDLRDRLTTRGVDLKITWVKGHRDNFGNILADKLATIGVMASKQKKIINNITTQEAIGYWSYNTNQHPLISNRRMYFNTVPEYIRKGEYYLGDHGKDDNLIGKQISDGAYSVVILDQPDNILELIRDYQVELAGNIDTIIMVRLDQIYKNETHRDITTYGTFAMEQPNPFRLDLLCLDKEPLTRELKPPKLAMRVSESISEIAIKLHEYLNENKNIVTTDLTPLLYNVTIKENKKEGTSSIIMKLKPEYNVGFAALKVDANYKVDNGIASTPLTLTLGIDMLDRNALKRLEDMNPKVVLITWLEAPGVFRYATVVQANKDVGIYAGCYSNLAIVPH